MSNATLDDGIKYVGEDLHEMSSFPGKLTMRIALDEKLSGVSFVGAQAIRHFPTYTPGRQRSKNL